MWVRAEFERLGVRARRGRGPRAHRRSSGDDVVELAQEVDKIATWAGGEPVGRREIEPLAVASGETFVWALTDAWGARDLPGVLKACETLLDRRVREPFGIAAALAGYVGRVRVAAVPRRGRPRRRRDRQAAQDQGLPGTQALVTTQKNYTRDELDAAVVRLSELDAALKGASRLPAELELERALVDVDRSAGGGTRLTARRQPKPLPSPAAVAGAQSVTRPASPAAARCPCPPAW